MPGTTRALLGILVLSLAMPMAWASAAVDCEQFAGTWRLERITDGERTRADLDEHITFDCLDGSIALEYRIVDRFGVRTLELAAPLDGTILEQRAQSRRARVSAQIAEGQLELRIEREAPFGHIHNLRRLRPDPGGKRLESSRVNFKKDGREHSTWRETWVRAG